MKRARVMGSAKARIALLFALAVLLWFPLSKTLQEIVRETRVDSAVGEMADSIFAVEGRSSIMNSQITYETGSGVHVLLRVATSEWFDDEDRVRFEQRTSQMVGERIQLTLQQLPAGADLQQLSAWLPGARETTSEPSASLPLSLQATRQRLNEVASTLNLPDSVYALEMMLATSGTGRNESVLTYLAPDTLTQQARSMVEGQLLRALALEELAVNIRHISSQPREVVGTDDAVIEEIAALATRFERAVVIIIASEDNPDGTATDGDDLDIAVQVRDALLEAGVPEERVVVRRLGGPLRLQLAAPQQNGSESASRDDPTADKSGDPRSDSFTT